MLKAFINSFKIVDLRKRILFTLGIICVYRLGAYIPVVGIDPDALATFYQRMTEMPGGALFGMMDMFSGGALSQCTIFALNVMPYITASIILQVLTPVVPALERLAKEGEFGRQKINQYTRIGTIFLAAFNSFTLSIIARDRGLVLASILEEGVPFSVFWFHFLTVVSMTAGTILIMWLGEIITERGIGNGISLIITANIISRLPTASRMVARGLIPTDPTDPASRRLEPITLIILGVVLLAVIVSIILITQGQRKIPVQYAKRIIGRKVYGGQSTYIPLRVNQAGVIPIIFAAALISFPALILGPLGNRYEFARMMVASLVPGKLLYTVVYVLFIIFFCYFYTAVIFNPVDIAENMKKYGGFVPGIRPGKPTADYLNYIMVRLTMAGAAFLAIIAILPQFINAGFGVEFLVAQFFGGTGVLIIVGVMLDTMRQIESQLLVRHYEGFMKKARIRGRR